MDNLTHTLVGIALSRAFFKKRVAFATTAMVVAANLPDLDLLYSWPGVRYLEYHRGVTHSVWMLPIWAALVALGLRWLSERRKQVAPAWGMAFLLGLVGAGSHVLLDWTNAYGTRLWSPTSQHWYGLDLMPIFDPWIWLLFAVFLGFPMLLSLISSEVGAKKQNPHRFSAVVALLLLVAWIGVRARQHGAALELLNAPNVAGMYEGQLPYNWAAFPTSDAFHWQAVIDLPANVLIADVSSPWDTDLGRVRPVRSYIKPPRVPAIVGAEQTPTGRIFLGFARFPFADVEDQGSESLVTITDMRFADGVRRPAMHAQIRLDGSLHVFSQSFTW